MFFIGSEEGSELIKGVNHVVDLYLYVFSKLINIGFIYSLPLQNHF